MRGQAEAGGEASHQVGRRGAHLAGQRPEGVRGGRRRVEQVAHRRRQGRLPEVAPAPGRVARPAGAGARGAPQVGRQPLRHQGEPGVGLERRRGGPQGAVQGPQAAQQPGVADGGPVDRRADEVLAQHGGVEVQHPLGEAATGRRPAVVGDVRG